jgi:hypothetical protein
MKWMVCLAFVVGCQRNDSSASSSAKPAPTPTPPPPPAGEVTDAYRADITTVCDVVRLSGADKGPPGERWTTTAMWLPSHLKTDAAHEFLVTIQPLAMESRAQALDAEAKRLGLGECALSAVLRNR